MEAAEILIPEETAERKQSIKKCLGNIALQIIKLKTIVGGAQTNLENEHEVKAYLVTTVTIIEADITAIIAELEDNTINASEALEKVTTIVCKLDKELRNQQNKCITTAISAIQNITHWLAGFWPNIEPIANYDREIGRKDITYKELVSKALPSTNVNNDMETVQAIEQFNAAVKNIHNGINFDMPKEDGTTEPFTKHVGATAPIVAIYIWQNQLFENICHQIDTIATQAAITIPRTETTAPYHQQLLPQQPLAIDEAADLHNSAVFSIPPREVRSDFAAVLDSSPTPHKETHQTPADTIDNANEPVIELTEPEDEPSIPRVQVPTAIPPAATGAPKHNNSLRKVHREKSKPLQTEIPTEKIKPQPRDSANKRWKLAITGMAVMIFGGTATTWLKKNPTRTTTAHTITTPPPAPTPITTPPPAPAPQPLISPPSHRIVISSVHANAQHFGQSMLAEAGFTNANTLADWWLSKRENSPLSLARHGVRNAHTRVGDTYTLEGTPGTTIVLRHMRGSHELYNVTITTDHYDMGRKAANVEWHRHHQAQVYMHAGHRTSHHFAYTQAPNQAQFTVANLHPLPAIDSATNIFAEMAIASSTTSTVTTSYLPAARSAETRELLADLDSINAKIQAAKPAPLPTPMASRPDTTYTEHTQATVLALDRELQQQRKTYVEMTPDVVRSLDQQVKPQGKTSLWQRVKNWFR